MNPRPAPSVALLRSTWDAGWDVKLGDEDNGFVAEGNFRTPDEAAAFLDTQARIHFAESVYALGVVEHTRREQARLKTEHFS